MTITLYWSLTSRVFARIGCLQILNRSKIAAMFGGILVVRLNAFTKVRRLLCVPRLIGLAKKNLAVLMVLRLVLTYTDARQAILIMGSTVLNQAMLMTEQQLMSTPLIVLPVRLLEWMVSATPPPVRAVTQKYLGFASKVILLLQTSMERQSFSVAKVSSWGISFLVAKRFVLKCG